METVACICYVEEEKSPIRLEGLHNKSACKFTPELLVEQQMVETLLIRQAVSLATTDIRVGMFVLVARMSTEVVPRKYHPSSICGGGFLFKKETLGENMGLKEDLEALHKETLKRIENASNGDALEDARIAIMGKKGSLTYALRGMRDIPKEERPSVGKVVNEVRDHLERAFEERKRQINAFELEKRMQTGALDISLPGRSQIIGTEHLINHIIREVSDIFAGIGYMVVDGREVETDYYNFTALNAPADHPSRSMQDTFYVVDRSGDVSNVRGESDVLLRTQTSGCQVHVMEEQKPPIYMISPGKVYRRDVADPSHLPQFHQIEGLVVDKGITFGDLKGTLDYFCKAFFGKERKTRFRAHFFPFTEPSAEADVSCGICHGEGCRFCKGTGWVEILGCGMVDPNVFEYVNIDPEVYTGFAFGVGVERLACLKYNVPDLRMLLEGDMRFLRQF